MTALRRSADALERGIDLEAHIFSTWPDTSKGFAYGFSNRTGPITDRVASMPCWPWPPQWIPATRIDLAALQLAIWYHDAVYYLTSGGNEEASALLLERDMGGLIHPETWSGRPGRCGRQRIMRLL